MKFVFGKQDMSSQHRAEETCWLLTNGLGGFASTSAAFSVTRCNQGLLIAVKMHNQQFNLVHRLSEKLTAGRETVFLSTQSFGDETTAEEGWRHLFSFVWEDGRIETGLGFICCSTQLTIPQRETKQPELVFSTSPLRQNRGGNSSRIGGTTTHTVGAIRFQKRRYPRTGPRCGRLYRGSGVYRR